MKKLMLILYLAIVTPVLGTNNKAPDHVFLRSEGYSDPEADLTVKAELWVSGKGKSSTRLEFRKNSSSRCPRWLACIVKDESGAVTRTSDEDLQVCNSLATELVVYLNSYAKILSSHHNHTVAINMERSKGEAEVSFKMQGPLDDSYTVPLSTLNQSQMLVAPWKEQKLKAMIEELSLDANRH